ncbi:MAG: sterol desaturase family protein [Planctomycetota bacterium]
MVVAAFFLAGCVFTSLVEYWAHRLMHRHPGLGRAHRRHHRASAGQGVLRELWDYLRYGFVLMLPMFPVSLEAGIGWLGGCLACSLFAAYAHQLQHENPAACFWMRAPLHHIHHRDNLWHHNFGLSLDVWDRVFGTYKRVEWKREADPGRPARGPLRVRWW